MNPYVLEYLLVQMYPPQEEVHIPVQVVLVVVGQVLAPLLVLVLIIVPAEVVLVVHLHILLLQEDPVRHIIEVVLLLHHANGENVIIYLSDIENENVKIRK